MKFSWKPVAASAALVMLPACGNPSHPITTTSAKQTAGNQSAAQPLPAETNPPGDIPDTQVFVTYEAPKRYSISFPEGWQRTEKAGSVTFLQGFDGERVRLEPSASSFVQSATAGFDAVRSVLVSNVNLPAKAILVAFTSNSQANSLTGKRVRLLNNTYVVLSGHGVALVDLWAPLGSDNADQWRRISRSFRWR